MLFPVEFLKASIAAFAIFSVVGPSLSVFDQVLEVETYIIDGLFFLITQNKTFYFSASQLVLSLMAHNPGLQAQPSYWVNAWEVPVAPWKPGAATTVSPLSLAMDQYPGALDSRGKTYTFSS